MTTQMQNYVMQNLRIIQEPGFPDDAFISSGTMTPSSMWIQIWHSWRLAGHSFCRKEREANRRIREQDSVYFMANQSLFMELEELAATLETHNLFNSMAYGILHKSGGYPQRVWPRVLVISSGREHRLEKSAGKRWTSMTSRLLNE